MNLSDDNEIRNSLDEVENTTDTFYCTNNTDLDSNFDMSVEDSCSDALDLSHSSDEGNINNGQNSSNHGKSDGQNSNWDKSFDNIPNFGFDTSNSEVKLDIPNGASPFDVFSLIWDDEIMNIILKSSNKYRQKLNSSKRLHTKNFRSKKYTDISFEELQKFFGLCLLRAELGISVLRNCFGTNPLNYHPIFNYTMSGRQFENILSCLNCSESTTNPEDIDRVQKISPLLNIVISKFQKSYVPTQNMSPSKSMLLWQGRIMFRQYIKNKRHKYGMKFYELCTTDGYVLAVEIEIYKGKNIENVSSSKINDLVLRLIKTYLNKGHQIFMDNFHNGVGLSNLLLEKKTYSTGTLKSNRKLNLLKITDQNIKLKEGEHKFARKGQVHVSLWKDKSNVLTITTGYHPELVKLKNKCGIKMTKPKQGFTYNENMSAIDRCDQMLSYNSSPRKTIKWHKKIMFHLLDIAVWNSFFVYKKRFPNYKGQFLDFNQDLVKTLIHLPTNIIHGKQLITSKKCTPKNINHKNVIQIENPVLHHIQEEIPAPNGWKRKKYFLRCRECFKSQKTVKNTSWRCKDCPELPPLCPGQCFAKYHKMQ